MQLQRNMQWAEDSSSSEDEIFPEQPPEDSAVRMALAAQENMLDRLLKIQTEMQALSEQLIKILVEKEDMIRARELDNEKLQTIITEQARDIQMLKELLNK